MIRGGSRTASVLVALLLATSLAACGGDDSKTAEPPRRTPSGSASAASETSTGTPTADPSDGVGPRKGALRGADILVFSRETLLEQVWGYRHAADTRLVNVHVQRLRAKVEHDPENPQIVMTVRGVGYKAGATPDPA